MSNNKQINEKQYMLVVKYSEGMYDDFCVHDIFATTDEEKAKAYCEKFNRIIGKWQGYWSTIVNEDDDWVDNDTYNFYRYHQITDINTAWYDKIEIR
jgi:hypothetical protein